MTRTGLKIPVGRGDARSVERVIAQVLQKGSVLTLGDFIIGKWDVTAHPRGVNVTSVKARSAEYIYCPKLRICFLIFNITVTNDAVAGTTMYFNLPFTGRDGIGDNQRMACWCSDNGAQQYSQGIIDVGQKIIGFRNATNVNWTVSATHQIGGNIFYLTN